MNHNQILVIHSRGVYNFMGKIWCHNCVSLFCYNHLLWSLQSMGRLASIMRKSRTFLIMFSAESVNPVADLARAQQARTLLNFFIQFCIRMLKNKPQIAWEREHLKPQSFQCLFFGPYGPRPRHYFSHCSSGPPVHFTHQTLTISSFGYLLWRNKRHCYPFYYSEKKKVSKRIWTHTLRTSSVMQCYTSLYPLRYEQLTAARVV